MGFSLELHVDGVVDAAMRALRNQLLKKGIHDLEMEYEYHPHVTLGYLEAEPSEVAHDVVRSLAPEIKVVPFNVGSVGIFRGDKTSVIFLAIVPSEELLKAHALAQTIIEERIGPMGPHYKTGQWIPHFTLAERVLSDDVPFMVSAVQELLSQGFPGQGCFERLALVTDKPVLMVPMSLDRFPSLVDEVPVGREVSPRCERDR